MPVRQLRPPKSADHESLVQALAAEWRQPDPDAKEPVILEEFDNGGNLLHVYVVWSRWEDMDRLQRGEIIMDAVEARYGQSDALNVTIALGLTPHEADQMNLAWK